MNEKVYRKIARTGAGSLVLGIVVLVTGIAAGVMMVINGAVLLHSKKDIMI